MKLTETQIVNTLADIINGCGFNIAFHSDKSDKLTALAKKNGYSSVIKYTEMTARKGLIYDHIKAVIEARKNGELPADNDGLNGRVWLTGYERLILVSPKTGKHLLRLYFSRIGKKKNTYYIINGTDKKTHDELKGMGIMQNSYFNSTKGLKVCFDIDMNNIDSIG